jgi:serine/threonine protein kinase
MRVLCVNTPRVALSFIFPSFMPACVPVCLQDMNLRELTLKYGRNVGLNITAVAIYAGQLLVALRHLQQCRVLHADIKPDNILVNVSGGEGQALSKACTFAVAWTCGSNLKMRPGQRQTCFKPI